MISDALLLVTLIWFVLKGLRHTPIAYTGYLWTELLAPQRVAVGILSTVPMSMIMAVTCVLSLMTVGGGLRRPTHTGLVAAMAIFLVWCWMTTQWATNPYPAALKFDWVWRSLLFTIVAFFIVRTRASLELFMLSVIACVAYFSLLTGLKTLVGGGGYGKRFVSGGVNFGLSESSTLGAMTVACIPLIVFIVRRGELLPRSRTTRWGSYAVIVVFVAAVIGTFSRTGLVCLGVLACCTLMLVKRRALVLAVSAIGAAAVFSVVGTAWLDRMSTLANAEEEGSAVGRLLVWRWTMDYARSHPFGAGFDAFLDNAGSLHAYLPPGSPEPSGNAKAYHSAYFEILGEQGYPGLFLFASIMCTTLLLLLRARRMSRLEGDRWTHEAATACLIGFCVLLVGSSFVGIAYRPYLYLFSVAAATLVRMQRDADPTSSRSQASHQA